jgi:DNA-binding GntR family transcriptional regulator
MIYSGSRPGSSSVMPDPFIPEYQRVANDLRRKIRTDKYKPGDRLPTKRQLAETYGTSLPTIDLAMVVLKTEGWVRGHQGRGTYVADPLPDHA